MNQEKLSYFKKKLLNQRSEIIKDAHKALNDQVHDEKENISDTVDRSSLETDRNFMLRLKDRERKLLKKVEEALERIEKNTFGICRGCGEYVSDNRLKARPVATLCIECKEEQEQKEKQKRW